MIESDLRLLMSYWYYRTTDLDEWATRTETHAELKILADSGAFSALMQGVTITCEQYTEWLERWKHHIDHYANLDVIMDAEATWDNQRRLEDMGYQPIPCFHVNEDWIWLERYVEQYDYVALGAAGMQERPAMLRWLVKCFQIAGDKAQLHGFGMTRWSLMRTFPFYSVDSRTWKNGLAYGYVPLFNPRTTRFERLVLGDHERLRQHAELIRSYGFQVSDFDSNVIFDKSKVAALGVLSYQRAGRWLRKHHGHIVCPKHVNDRAGIHIYFADPRDLMDLALPELLDIQ